MSYSDLQLKNATQVAYAEFDAPFKQLVNAGETPPFTISALCKQMGTKIDVLFPDLDGQDVSEWRIVDIYNNNAKTGFYGCVIDVGNGEAIVAFRGSESMLNLSNLKHDYGEADLRLLNSILTKQQGDVYKFLKKISESEYIKDYDSIAMTGHSLGGNLAMHGAVASAMPGIGLDGKLKRCVSFDGPGFSDEYIEKNRKYIDKVANKVDHFKWSPVGGLLFEFPGVPRIPLKFKEKKDFLYNLITRHSTESIEFENETAVRGEETEWDVLTSKFSQGIDRMPNIIGDTLVAVTYSLMFSTIWFLNQMFEIKKGKIGKMKPFGKVFLVAAVAFVAYSGVNLPLLILGNLIIGAAIVFISGLLYEGFCEIFEYVVNEVAEKIAIVYKWAKDKVGELKTFIAEGVAYVKNWLQEKFNRGYVYAASNPQIALDTYKLRSYAERIMNVNRRLAYLDRQMDDMYKSVGLLDLWNLLQADLCTKYSWRLLRAAEYLNDTAADFEAAETELANV